MKKLLVYPNCSKGGVATVIRGRAVADPDSQFHCVFVNDRGGRDAFADLPNVQVRIIRRDRLNSFLAFMSDTHSYDRISILSDPSVLNASSFPGGSRVCYEFHSGKLEQVVKELRQIDHEKVTELVVPSFHMGEMLRPEVPRQWRTPVIVDPNLVDTRAFHDGAPAGTYFDSEIRPLLWVGRFDKDKAIKYFIRMLSALPEEYHGFAFVSLEADPLRAADILGEVYASGVGGRFHLMMNLPQRRLSDMFREARELGGALVSTSLLESFGYSVLEALATGLRVHAFELPVFSEHPDPKGLLHQVDIGDVGELVGSVLESA